jgi:kynurenine formamidase
MAKRWTRRPEGSTWGDFGENDERGRLNLLTPEKVRQGVAEVREGMKFCLSLPLTLPGGTGLNPRRHPPELKPVVRQGRVAFSLPMQEINPLLTNVSCDDAICLHNQYSTQWDALAHYGQMFDIDGSGVEKPVFYNGFSVHDPATGKPTQGDVGAAHLGIENMAEACVQGRAVMLDLHAHYGREHEPVGYRDLMAILEKDGVEIEEGDILCIHTGWSDMLLEYGGAPDAGTMKGSCPALNGRDPKVLQWISDSGIAVVACDNRAVEYEWLTPSSETERHTSLELHEHCLFKLGVHLGEMWNFGPLARWLRENGRNRFLITAPPLNMPGAVGSPANPIATV